LRSFIGPLIRQFVNVVSNGASLLGRCRDVLVSDAICRGSLALV